MKLTEYQSVREYLSDVARKAGKSKSKAKAEAARKNGLKGGRPKGKSK